MPLDGGRERKNGPSTGNDMSVAAKAPLPRPAARKVEHRDRRLRQSPSKDHVPERYDDAVTEVDPVIFSALERHLPASMLDAPRGDKYEFMREILARYMPDGERNKIQRHKEYRARIKSGYKPLHKELYTMHPESFFLPSFIKAVKGNTEESFRTIISEPSPGMYAFPMLQPRFCQLLSEEIGNFEKWAGEGKFKIMRPNTMNKYGAVLDDFGLGIMLTKLMEEFVSPLSTVFFPEVGGATLDSHHGFVVEYGKDKDVDLGFHVDDSEVTLNVCLGKKFSGGELFFHGVRCDQHINSETQPEEIVEYSHIPGVALLHRGRHRHGAHATTSGHSINMILWCRSSLFREMRNYQKDFSSWCSECQREKTDRQHQSVAATKMAFLRSGTGTFI